MFLEHVNFTVSDLERSIDFYTHLFDFKVRWKGTVEDGRLAAHVGDDRQYLALFEATSPGQVKNQMTEVGLNHFGFVVLNVMSRSVRRGVGIVRRNSLYRAAIPAIPGFSDSLV